MQHSVYKDILQRSLGEVDTIPVYLVALILCHFSFPGFLDDSQYFWKKLIPFFLFNASSAPILYISFDHFLADFHHFSEKRIDEDTTQTREKFNKIS